MLRCAGFLFGFLALAVSRASPAAPLPNIVLILVDDLGWHDLSCQGSTYFRTPHIDELARQGMRFTDAYAAAAICSPTRAAVMTGRSPARIGVTDWIRAKFQRHRQNLQVDNPQFLCPTNPLQMELDEVTIAELLRPVGYATYHIGKWHLGDRPWYPERQGFDGSFGGCDIGEPPTYFDPYVINDRHTFDGQLQPRRAGEFLTHREGDEARRYIHEHKDGPFFLYYCPYAVHTPIEAIDEVADRYASSDKTEENAKYAAMVESVDDAVR